MRTSVHRPHEGACQCLGTKNGPRTS
jgi:hypothetical protein